MEQKTRNQEWNWLPKIPIDNNPLFSWPLNIKAIIKWYAPVWFSFSEIIFCLLVAIILCFFFQPTLETYKIFNFQWTFLIYIRNIGIMFLIAGGLHLFFYSFQKQNNDSRYDSRDFTKGKRFTFNSQILDNMFWTIVSGVSVWTAYEVFFMWSYANDLTPRLIWGDNPLWFCALFFLIVMWESIHFYLIHRLLHWPFFYKLAHSVHHRNINTGPWSGISMHPIEHILYFSSVLIHFVIPSHPLHFVFHLMILTIGAVIGHCGYDAIISKKNKVSLGHFHHQLHHRYFECNYGTKEAPCDVWFDSFHDGSPEATTRMREKRNKVHKI